MVDARLPADAFLALAPAARLAEIETQRLHRQDQRLERIAELPGLTPDEIDALLLVGGTTVRRNLAANPGLTPESVIRLAATGWLDDGRPWDASAMRLLALRPDLPEAAALFFAHCKDLSLRALARRRDPVGV